MPDIRTVTTLKRKRGWKSPLRSSCTKS